MQRGPKFAQRLGQPQKPERAASHKVLPAPAPYMPQMLSTDRGPTLYLAIHARWPCQCPRALLILDPSRSPGSVKIPRYLAKKLLQLSSGRHGHTCTKARVLQSNAPGRPVPVAPHSAAVLHSREVHQAVPVAVLVVAGRVLQSSFDHVIVRSGRNGLLGRSGVGSGGCVRAACLLAHLTPSPPNQARACSIARPLSACRPLT